MIRKGSFIVPHPNRYLPLVYHGKVGKVELAGKKGETLVANLLSVKFEGSGMTEPYRLFRKDEVRPATREEVRAHKFVINVATMTIRK